MFFLLSVFFISCNEIEEPQEEPEVIPEWFVMDESSLCGWTNGIFNQNCFVLGKTAEDIGYIYMSLFSANEDEGVIMMRDTEGNISSVIIGDRTWKVSESESTILLSEFDEDGVCLNTISFVPDSDATKAGIMTKAEDSHDNFLECIEEGKELLEKISGIQDMAQNVVDRGLVNAIRDEIVQAGALKKYKKFEKLNDVQKKKVEDLLDHIDSEVEDFRENESLNMFGHIGIEILDVYTQGADSYIVNARVYNINTAPSYWFDYKLECHPNELFCGVVAGDKTIYYNIWPSYYTCMYQSAMKSVPQGANSHNMSFLMSGINTTGTTVRFRPYIISGRELDGYIAYPKGEFVIYGNGVEYVDNYAYIDNCRTISAEYDGSADAVRFQASVNVTHYCENGEKWGIFMMKDGSRQMFPAKSPSLRTDIVDVTFPVNEMSLNYNAYSASCQVSFGVYNLHKDGSYSYSELEPFELNYTERPTIEFTSASIIGTRSTERNPRMALMSSNPDDEEEEEEEEEEEGYDYVTAFEQSFTITGALWLNAVHYASHGTPTFSASSYSVTKDGNFRTSGKIYYDSDMVSLDSESYYSLELRNGSIIPEYYGSYVNKLHWSGDEEITNVQWY